MMNDDNSAASGRTQRTHFTIKYGNIVSITLSDVLRVIMADRRLTAVHAAYYERVLMKCVSDAGSNTRRVQ